MDKQRVANGKGCFPSKTCKQSKLWFQQRLQDAYDLATALQHLHQKRIIHRDIKPCNVGFDLRGVVKLVDFGFARQLPDEANAKDGRYLMSGMTGSIRYMAPEVYKGLPYNSTCDSYSFTIMVWEILTLKKPFDNMGTLDCLVRRVFERGQRPAIPRTWPRALRKMMKQGWEQDLAKRADMTRVLKTLVCDARNSSEAVDTVSLTSQGERRNKSSGNLVRRYSSRVFELSREMRPILRISSAFKKQLQPQNSDALTCIAEDQQGD